MRNWGRVVVGALLIVLGIGWFIELTGAVELNSGVLASVALMLVGAGLVIGSRQGNYPGLIVLGVVLMLVLGSHERTFTSGPSDRILFRTEVRDKQTYRPRTTDDLRPYRAKTGPLRIILDRMEISDAGTHRVEARVSAGDIHVTVPSSVALRVNSRVSAGSLKIDWGGKEVERKGVNIRDTHSFGRFDDASRKLVLDLRVGVGRITVDDR